MMNVPRPAWAAIAAILPCLPVVARAGDGAAPATAPLVELAVEAGPQVYTQDCYGCNRGDRVEAHVRLAGMLRVARLGQAAIYLVLPVDVSEAFHAGPIQGNATMFDYRSLAITPGVEARIPVGDRTAVAFALGYGRWGTDVPCTEDCDGPLVNRPHSDLRLGIGLQRALSATVDLRVDADLQSLEQAGPYAGVFVGLALHPDARPSAVTPSTTPSGT